MRKNILNYIGISSFLIAIFLVLTEGFSVKNIIFGLFSLLALLFAIEDLKGKSVKDK